jgi:PAS domain S-box-containing protein
VKKTNHDDGQIKRTVIRITLLFFSLSVAWIFLSDLTVDLLFAPGPSQGKAQTVKGILFVAATTVLVFWLSKRAFARVAGEAQTALARRTEVLFNTVMTHLGEAVILVDPPRRTIVGCNSAVEAVLGYSEEELTGNTTALLHTDEHSFKLFGTISEPELDQQRIFRCEYTLRHKDGHPVPAEITVVALQGTPGWRAGVISIIRDMSSQRKAEEDLHKSEEQYRLLAENTLDLIWEMTPDLVFTYVNPAITKVAGYTPSEFIGTSLGKHVDPADLKKLKKIIEDEIAKGPNPAKPEPNFILMGTRPLAKSSP